MDVTIPTSAGSIHGYLAVPQPEVSGDGPWPAVVIVHDAFGMSDDVREIADRFGTAGYFALVPDLFHRGGFVRCVQSVFRQLLAAKGQAFDDIEAARQELLSHPNSNGKVGVAGFCMGGGFALVTAARGFDASAPYYGPMPRDESAFDDACPIVASFGGRDFGLRGAAAKLDQLLTEREVVHDVKEYAGAGHGFANRLPVGPFAPLMRIAGLGYDHDANQDAWRRVLTFFATHLS
ncbi:dienelactone hydrolase family protein [Fodinicola feengrottensis]|uniref:Dienelactone hydrolase family protein n=1 Tax=Fodinicola feengrottensis TaxID=435914 RepID=A0ABN2H8Y4_9ACTN